MGSAAMNSEEILSLLEQPRKPSPRGWRHIRRRILDQASVADLVAALRASSLGETRAHLCYLLQLRAGLEKRAARTSETAQAIPALTEALSDPDKQVRSEARQALDSLDEGLVSQDSPQDTIDRLLTQLQQGTTSAERKAAATELADLTDGKSNALAQLLSMLDDADSQIRYYALLTIAKAAERQDAAWFVQAHRDDAQGPLIQKLRDPDSSIRAVAAQALAGWGDSRAVEPLLATARDPDDEVRRHVLAALSYPRDDRAVEVLWHAFSTDPDWQVRVYAAQGLAEHREDRRAVDRLIHDLQDQRSEIRIEAAQLLSYLRDERAIEALMQARRDPNSLVRDEVMEALWSLTNLGNELSMEATAKLRDSAREALADRALAAQVWGRALIKWLE